MLGSIFGAPFLWKPPTFCMQRISLCRLSYKLAKRPRVAINVIYVCVRSASVIHTRAIFCCNSDGRFVQDFDCHTLSLDSDLPLQPASTMYCAGLNSHHCCEPKCSKASYTIIYLRRTPHPAIVTIRDNKDYIRVLLYSSITGWGVLLHIPQTDVGNDLGVYIGILDLGSYRTGSLRLAGTSY